MRKAFLSYSREDLAKVEKLEKALRQEGVTVWRDQEALYGGQQWPKAIGEALAASNFFLLVWSKHAARSHFVEFEWTTAIALRKPILPCLLDETPFPKALQAIQLISLENIQAALPLIMKSLQTPLPETPPRRSSEVIKKLQGINTAKPEQVANQARLLFAQQGWNVRGDVSQTAGVFFPTIQAPEGSKEKSRLDPWVKILGLVGTILAIVIALFTLSEKISEKFFPETGTSYLRGMVRTAEGDPIADALVRIEEFPEVSVFTTSDGGFYLSGIPGTAGDRVRVFVEKEGFKKHNEYVTLPGPVAITLGN